jgi:hypothetical protein
MQRQEECAYITSLEQQQQQKFLNFSFKVFSDSKALNIRSS